MRPINWPFILCPFWVFAGFYILSDLVQYYFAGTTHPTLWHVAEGTFICWLGLLTEWRVVLPHIPKSLRPSTSSSGVHVLCISTRVALYITSFLVVIYASVLPTAPHGVFPLLEKIGSEYATLQLLFFLIIQGVIVLIVYFGGLTIPPDLLIARNKGGSIFFNPSSRDSEKLHPFWKTPFVELPKTMLLKGEVGVKTALLDKSCLLQYQTILEISHSSYYFSQLPNRDRFLLEARIWFEQLIKEKMGRVELISTPISNWGIEKTVIQEIDVKWDGLFQTSKLVYYI